MTNEQAERLIAAVERLASAAEALVQGQQRKTSSPAKFIKPIEEFPNFDWGSIGAKVEFRDSDRIVAGVSWRGATYERKSKHGDVWFSRNVGKDDEDNPIYETLIKFAANVVPNSLPTSMVRAFNEQPATTSTTGPTVSAPAPQPQPQAQTPQTISQKQFQDLKSRAQQSGFTGDGFQELLEKYGFKRGNEITTAAYKQMWSEACDRNMAMLLNARAEAEMIPH